MSKTVGLPLQKSAWQHLFWFLAVTGIFVYLVLFIFPNTPLSLSGDDDQIYLLNATRMWEGQVMYRDFFHFLPPGTELIYEILFALFGLRAWIPNALLVMLGLALTFVTTELAKKVLPGAAAFLPGLLFFTFAFSPSMPAAHHLCSALAVLIAMAIVIDKRTTGRIALSAAVCGIASCFTQTWGVAGAGGLAVFLLWEGWHQGDHWRAVLKRLACVTGAFLIVEAMAITYFSRDVGLPTFFDSTFVYVMRYWSKDLRWSTYRAYLSDFPQFLPWYRLPTLGVYLFVHLLLPLVYLLFIARHMKLARLRPAEPWDKLMLLNIMGLALFLSVAAAPAWERLCPVAPPGMILLVWLLSEREKLSQVLVKALWLITLVLALAEVAHTQTRWKGQLDLPRGRTAFTNPDQYEKFEWLLHRTRPSEFLFEAGFPSVYYSLELRDPSEVPLVTANDYTRPEQVQQTVDSLEKNRVRFVLWMVDLDIPYENRTVGDHLGPLRDYLRLHYRVVKAFAAEQVWERID